MHRRVWLATLVAVGILAAIALGIGIGAHWGGDDWGWGHRLQTVQVIGGSGDQSGRTVDVVTVPGPGRHHLGFFPFGILFPLFGLLLLVALLRWVFWGHRWHAHHAHLHGPGNGWHGGGAPGATAPGGQNLDDWHRRQHAAPDATPPPTSGPDGEPAHPQADS